MDNSKPPKFWRNIRGVEYEIAYQILFAELSFDICEMIPQQPGLGNNLLPYLYNLNFSKGVNSLHSLLVSKQPDEISLEYYFKQHQYEYKSQIDQGLLESIAELKHQFENLLDVSIRNKITAHTDLKFAHTDFTSAYMLPSKLPEIKSIIVKLKKVFFEDTNHSLTDDPMWKIRKQAEIIIDYLVKNP